MHKLKGSIESGRLITQQPANGELGDLVQAVKAIPVMQTLPPSITIIDQGQAETWPSYLAAFDCDVGRRFVSLGVYFLFGRVTAVYYFDGFTALLLAVPLSA